MTTTQRKRQLGQCAVCGHTYPAIRREPRSREENRRRKTLPIIKAATKPGGLAPLHGWLGEPYCEGSNQPTV